MIKMASEHVILKALINGALVDALMSSKWEYIVVDDSGKTLKTRIGEILTEFGNKVDSEGVVRIITPYINNLIDGASTNANTLKKLETLHNQNDTNITNLNTNLVNGLAAKVDKSQYDVTIRNINDFLNLVLTESQTRTLIKQAVDDLIGGAPGTADTLKELYDLINSDKELSDALVEALGKKADAEYVQNALDAIDTKLTEMVTIEDVYGKGQVNELLLTKANVSDVYTQTQIDAKLNEKANASGVYTKSETDAALLTKANASNVYTKSETDELVDEIYDELDLKANASEVYSQEEIDNMFADLDLGESGGGSGEGGTGSGGSGSSVDYEVLYITIDGEWSGSESPYTKDVTIPGVTADSVVLVAPNPNIDEEKLEALGFGCIIGGTQSENTVQLLAYGEPPEKEIPLMFVVIQKGTGSGSTTVVGGD